MSTILLTGITGAIGSALAPRLLRDPQVRILALVRADSPERLAERAAGLWAYWGADLTPEARERLTFLRGDVERERLGLSDADYELCRDRLTHLVHAAGEVKLNQTLEEARQHAVRPLQELVALARQAQGRFRKFDYLSTVGVLGRRDEPLPERPVAPAESYHNAYEEGKAEAERALLAEMEAGLPATIYRPSMVVGDATTGKIIRFQVFYHLSRFLTGQNSMGLVPDAGAFRLDLIPSDYVAGAIALGLFREDARGRIFNLCSGPEGALPLSELTEWLLEWYSAAGVALPTLRRVKLSHFAMAVDGLRKILPEKAVRALAGAPFILAYLASRQDFSNQEGAAYFHSLGLGLPSARAYLPVIMRYYLEASARAAASAARGAR